MAVNERQRGRRTVWPINLSISIEERARFASTREALGIRSDAEFLARLVRASIALSTTQRKLAKLDAFQRLGLLPPAPVEALEPPPWVSRRHRRPPSIVKQRRALVSEAGGPITTEAPIAEASANLVPAPAAPRSDFQPPDGGEAGGEAKPLCAPVVETAQPSNRETLETRPDRIR